jgi:Cu+-exporting ATPase
MASSSPDVLEAAPLVTDLLVTGMNCANCAQHVTEALQRVSGVDSANVSLQEGRARVRWRQGSEGKVASLVQAVAAAGYEAKPAVAVNDEKKPSALAGWRFNVVVGLAGAGPLMGGEWIFHWDEKAWFQWLSFALALMVQVLCGARFYRGAWRQLRSGSSNMDTLVALGSTTAFGYSTWALLSGAGGHLYFMEAAAIITLISVGHWMEELSSSYAEKSLRALFGLAPETARRHNADGTETEVPVAELHPGDLVVLRPGSRVPTDGTVTQGRGSVDEAMLTGESLPVEKEMGGNLYAGTVNLDGQVLMRVTGVGEATAVAHIIAAVQRAQNSRAQIQRLADRISNVFVPIVVAIAISAGLWWGLAFTQAQRLHEFLGRFLWMTHMPATPLTAGILGAVAVLVVACPCAMGLATPVAIMAGTNAAAKRGILIRDGIALEKAGRLTSVLADKTGTLTLGKPEVVESVLLSNADAGLKLAAALARGSSHPLSVAVAKLSPDKMNLSGWREIHGAGVEAQLARNGGNATARLGSVHWLKTAGVDTSPGDAFAEKWMAGGATILGLAINEQLAAMIALRDSPKPGIAQAVQKLRNMGLKIFLVTGDNQRTAKAIAGLAGIDAGNVFAEVRPGQKADMVRQLQEKGERVAFVGDGINDAPALEQADLGIAVSEASDVANEAADIILLQSNIEAIPEAIALAQAALRTIKQNLFWAFFYNAAAIPLAALGFLSPILCAAAMGLSDLVVIGNALRLGRRTAGGDGKPKS